MLQSESDQFDDEQLERWLDHLEMMRGDKEVPSLKEASSTWPELSAALSRNPVLADELTQRLDKLRKLNRVLSFDGVSSDNCPQVRGFEISGVLGHGGAGAVYRARQLSLGRDVALKLMLGGRFASSQSRQRFRTEAQTAARLQHPHIVQIYDHGEVDGVPYLAQELAGGGTLADCMATTSASTRKAAELIETLAEAMDYAHQNGVVHRDLKPSNVLLTRAGLPKIGDFGLAKLLDSSCDMTRTGESLGTPNYMAPEQVNGGPVGPWTDVYGLGAILYEMLAGQPPFSGVSTADVFDSVRTLPPPAPWRISRRCPIELGAIALKCLEKQPLRRYDSAAALARDLRRWLDGEPTVARPIGGLRRLGRWARRRPAAAALVSVIAAAVVVLAIVVSRYTVRQQQLLAIATEQQLEAESQRIAAVRQREIADEKSRAAEESARMSRASEARVRQHVYVADMRMAQQLLHDGDLASLVPLLDRRGARDEGLSLGETPALPGTADSARASAAPQLEETSDNPFEWQYLNHFRGACQVSLDAHDGPVDLLAFRAEGDVLATSGVRDGQIRLWEIPSGQLLGSFPVRKTPAQRWEEEAAALSQDGRRVAALVDASTVVVWDVARRAELARFKHDQTVLTLAFSPDGARICAGGEKQTVLWSCDAREQVSTHPAARLLAVAPDGRQMAVVGSQRAANLVHLCDLTATHVEPELALPGPVRYISYSPDGTMLACLADYGQSAGIYVYHSRTGAMLHNGDNRRGERYQRVGFSSDNRWLVASASDGSLKFWDMRSHEPVGTLRGPATRLIHFAFSPDGRWLATSTPDGKVLIWDKHLLTPCEDLVPANEILGPLAFSPDGKTLAACTPSHEVLLIGTASSQVESRLPHHIDAIRDLFFSPDGTRLVTTDGETVRCWRWRDGSQLWSATGHRAACVSFSPHADLVASGGFDQMIYLYNAIDGSERAKWTGLADIRGLRFLPYKPVLVSAGNDGTIRYWAFMKGGRLVTDYAHIDPAFNDITIGEPQVASFAAGAAIQQFALSADGRNVAAGCKNGELKAWRLNDVLPPEKPSFSRFWAGEPPAAFAFSPDGQTLGIGGNGDSVQAIDMRANETLYSLSGRRVGGTSVAYSPDGHTLATISREECLTLWDLSQWQTRTLAGSPLMPVRSLAFSSDGIGLAIATDDSIAPDRPLTDDVPAGPNVRRFMSRQTALSLGTNHSIHFDAAPWDTSGSGFRVWDVATGRERLLPGACTTLTAVPHVAWSSRDIVAAGSHDGTVWIWNTGLSRLLARFAVNPASADAIGWQPQAGRRLVTPRALERLDGVTALAFSADGSKLAVATRSGIVQLVDADNWENRTTLMSDTADVACLAFSPSGSILLANRRGQLLCWHLSDAIEIPCPRRLGEVQDSPVASVTFSHDAQTLAVGRHDGTVEFVGAQFLDASQPESARAAQLLLLTGHLDRVAAMCFSPDDRTLATGSWDATVRLWHVASGQELAVLRAHHDKVEAVAFSPDGSVLATGGHRDADHGEVFLWRTSR